MKRILLVTIAFSFLFGATQNSIGQNCVNLPKSFSSYEQACKLVKSSTFKLQESVNTSKSSWIRGASYYSCYSNEGFLIIKTDDREYIHQNVPIEVWRNFKNANSFGSYYDHFIKGNYRVTLKSQN